MNLVWHEGTHVGAAHVWLREQILKLSNQYPWR
jgi:hypothetical protein